MQEITQLFARGQQDVARQFDETAQRLDRAAAAVTKGEERITAQIAAFERATGEARQMAAEHERASRELMEQFRRTASELAGEGIRPLKTQVDNVTRQLSDATARVAEASSGFSNAMDLAIGSVNHRAERLLERQAETFAETVSGTMESGRAALTAAAGALDSAAGVLTQRIIETAEAQDAKLRTFEALTRDMETMRLALPAPEAAAAQAQRIEEATLSMNQASDSIGRAVGELLSLRNAEAELTLGHTETAGAPTALAERRPRTAPAMSAMPRSRKPFAGSTTRPSCWLGSRPSHVGKSSFPKRLAAWRRASMLCSAATVRRVGKASGRCCPGSSRCRPPSRRWLPRTRRPNDGCGRPSPRSKRSAKP